MLKYSSQVSVLCSCPPLLSNEETVSAILVVTKERSELPSQTTEEDWEQEEATGSSYIVTAASADAAVVTVLSDLGGIFTAKSGAEAY